MERSVEVLAIIFFGIIGLSHIMQPKCWAEFFILLRGKGEAGVFVDGFLNLQIAGIIIGFHNVWSGIPAVLTLVGWCLLIKSLLRFCLPKLGLMLMTRVSVQRSWEFQVAGAGLLVLAGLLGYGVTLSKHPTENKTDRLKIRPVGVRAEVGRIEVHSVQRGRTRLLLSSETYGERVLGDSEIEPFYP